MQNKGAIRVFGILLALACIFYLSFSFITRSIEQDARTFAAQTASKPEITELARKKSGGNADAEKYFLDSAKAKTEYLYIDSIRKLKVDFPFYGWLFTYEDCKDHEINLGLDLKGGINVTMEVSTQDIIRNMSSKPDDPVLITALGKARVREQKEKKHFSELFAEELKKLNPGSSLASYFRTPELKDKIDFNTTDETVIALIKERVDESLATSEKTLRARIDKFGVTQPNIQKLEVSGRILIELPGVSDKERVRKLLQGTANLEFWETFENKDIIMKLVEADKRLAEILSPVQKKDTSLSADSLKPVPAEVPSVPDTLTQKSPDTANSDTSILGKLGVSAGDTDSATKAITAVEDTSALAKAQREHPLFYVMQAYIDQQSAPIPGPVIGRSLIKDTAKVISYLTHEKIKRIFPENIRFAWTYKPVKGAEAVTQLVALKVTRRDKKPALYGDIMTDARVEYDQKQGGRPQISMTMTDEAAQVWATLTGDNIGKSIAIVLDNFVYSYPTVQSKIPGGQSQITGDFSQREAQDLVNILKAGKMPAPARIVEETVVGPTLGAESIQSGFRSFLIALAVVFVFMLFYYSRAGLVADIVLFCNMFFIVGVLASLGAVLTLPGIAGIVLVIGISVDANILIFERVREELRGGKGVQLAISEGYRHALSSIMDSNITTLLLAIILYAYGTGPVQGFATTLIIGILCSLFSSIFISRLILEGLLARKMDISFSIPLTQNAFSKVNIDFVKKRKLYYIFSAAIIAAGAFSFFAKGGFTLGVDFKGGRSYYVRFEQPVTTESVGEALRLSIGSRPEVKTFGDANQVRITTSFMIDDTSSNAESIVEEKVNEGLKTFGSNYEIVQQQKVGETISRDLRNNAVWTMLFACLIMFLYILIRFKGWQYGLGATLAVMHDVAVVLSCYAIFDGLLPFTLEINQDFIAAILTVMGYSMTDTVVVFDRIREYLREKGKKDLQPGEEKNRIINYALNSTLSRTMITSLTTFFVLVVIFFFGGEVIRSFAFALLIGIVIGTYSSICIATPIVIDFDRRKKMVA